MTSGHGAPRLLPAATRVATRWKNGGGITREVALRPSAAATGFDWRISVADIEGAGPFSRYAGVDRTLAVLEGQLELKIDAEPPLLLTPRSAAAYFAGEANVCAVPLSATSRDLNIMVRRGAWRSTLETRFVDSDVRITAAAGVTVVFSLGESTLRCRDGQWTLGYLDAALFEGSSELQVAPLRENAALLLVRLLDV